MSCRIIIMGDLNAKVGADNSEILVNDVNCSNRVTLQPEAKFRKTGKL